MRKVRSSELLLRNFCMFIFLLKVIGALLLQMLLKIHEIRFYDYYTWLSENVMLLVFLKWVQDKRESLPATELVAYFIYEWNGRIFCGEEEKFFLLAETVEFFSSTRVLVQLDISDRAEIWTVMLKKKKRGTLLLQKLSGDWSLPSVVTILGTFLSRSLQWLFKTSLLLHFRHWPGVNKAVRWWWGFV